MLCASGFVDSVMFSHNGANGPESKTARMFSPVRKVAAPRVKSAASDCMGDFMNNLWTFHQLRFKNLSYKFLGRFELGASAANTTAHGHANSRHR